MNPTSITVDFTGLRAIAGDEDEFVLEILSMIQEESPSVMDKMSELVALQAFPELAKTAHKFKSSVNVLGSSQINTLLKNIELSAADTPDVGELGAMVREIQSYCDLLLDKIGEEIDKLQP